MEAATATKATHHLDALGYLARKCSLVGINVEDVPDSIKDKAKEYTKEYENFGLVQAARREVNTLLASYRETLGKEMVPEELKPVLKDVVRPTYGVDAQELRSAIASRARRMREYQDNLSALLREQSLARRRLAAISQEAGIDITDKAQQILNLGWFKLAVERTKDQVVWDEHKRDWGLFFTTPVVYCRHTNPAAGIDMSVNMGSYLITWHPNKSEIKVYSHHDNLDIDDHIHPHIDRGHVCWGNAAETYRRSMIDIDPAPAFEALKTILQTYNDESPYVDLVSFAAERDPSVLNDLRTEMMESEDMFYINANEMDSLVPAGYHMDDCHGVDHTEYNGDDEPEEYRITAYYKVYEGTPRRVRNDTDTYVRFSKRERNERDQLVRVTEYVRIPAGSINRWY